MSNLGFADLIAIKIYRFNGTTFRDELGQGFFCHDLIAHDLVAHGFIGHDFVYHEEGILHIFHKITTEHVS